MKRLVSCLMAPLLVLVLSVPAPAYAYTADNLANKLYSGWSTTSTPLSGSWYALVKSYLSGIDADLSLYLPYLRNLGSSTDGNASNTLVGLAKHFHSALGYSSDIAGQATVLGYLRGIYNNSASSSSSSSAWTSSQATTVTNNTSSISSVVSAISDKLIYLEPIYDNSVTIDSNVSTINTNFTSLMSGWLNPQIGRYYNVKPTSWFGVIGRDIDYLYTGLVRDSVDVTSMTDSNFGKSNWYTGVYGTLYRLQQVLADDDDLQMRQDSEENKNVAKDAFLSYDSDTSVKPSDIGGLSNLGSGLRNNFDTGTVAASNLFDFWGSDNTFSWFTQETKNNMVNVSSSGSGALLARAQNDEPIYYSPYGEHMDEYERLMREGIK